MKTLILAILACGLIGSTAFARDTYVHGYMRSNGTYVQGYHRTTPDDSVNNNYGTQGNINPYTGQEGSRPRRAFEQPGEYNPGNGLGRQHNGFGNSDGFGSDNE